MRQQHVLGDVRERRSGLIGQIPRRMVVVDGGAVVYQPKSLVPEQQVGIARRAVHVRHERVEPDDVGRELWRDEVAAVGGIERERAGQEVHSQIEPGARVEQILYLRIGLRATERGVELHEHQLGHVEPEPAGELAREQLGR